MEKQDPNCIYHHKDDQAEETNLVDALKVKVLLAKSEWQLNAFIVDNAKDKINKFDKSQIWN